MKMEFDNIHQIHILKDYWLQFYSNAEEGKSRGALCLYGPRGCGKTNLAQEYLRTFPSAQYFSFLHLTNRQALARFAAVFLPGKNAPQSWQEACAAVAKEYKKQVLLFFFDDLEFFSDAAEFREAWKEATKKTPRLTAVFVQRSSTGFLTDRGEIAYRTIADYCKALPEYDRANVVRLYALTGGIPAAARNICANRSYEENLHVLLQYDSAFSTLMPQWMNECFRSPESYYPILDSIAHGHHRLSEIAADAGYAGNKCKTYLDALIKADFVIAENSRYRLKNSYYKAWCLYVYECRHLQIKSPEALIEKVVAELDTELAMPAFRESCLRYMQKADKDYLHEGLLGKLKRDVTVSLPYAGKVHLDFCYMQQYCSVIGVCPEHLDDHVTKKTAETIISAVRKYCTLYNTDVVMFSAGRFSDWCVHLAAETYWLHEVTADRLKL